jgi:hypothetical protein
MSTVQVNGPQKSQSIDISWRSVLDGVVYRFRLKYRERYDCWDLQIAESDGSIIIDGIRVTEGIDLLYPYSDPRLPPGELICVDTQGLGAAPTRRDWRERHILKYNEFVEIIVDNELASSEALAPS